MISIKPSSFPEYLKESAFFGNLGEDDEEVSVPEDCCKLDTSVTNAADLDELLRTLRFWGVDSFPTSVVDFLKSTDPAVWKTVTANYVTDLPLLAPCVQVYGCEREKRVCMAASLRDVSLVTDLLENGFPAEHESDNMDAPTRAVDIAAGNGDVEILKVLRLHKCEYYSATREAAALGGHVPCLEYLIQNDCPGGSNLFLCGLRSGKVEIIQFLYDRSFYWPQNIDILRQLYKDDDGWDEEFDKNVGVCLAYAYQLDYPYDPDTYLFACMHGWHDLLVDAYEHHGCTLDSRCTRAAAERGHLDCLIYLLENGCPWDERLADNALQNKQFDCFKCAVEHGCAITERTFITAVISGSVEMVQYLHDRGLPWPAKMLTGSNFFGVRDRDEVNSRMEKCLLFAYQLGCPRDPQSGFFACKFGWLDLLVDAHQHGCEMNEELARQAAGGGHLSCLSYLHENGCPWDQRLIQSLLYNLTYLDNFTEHEITNSEAQRDRYYDCLIYAVEHGCPKPNHDFSCWWPEDAELQQYLIDKGGVSPYL